MNWSWLAGFFDGEGCISIVLSGGKYHTLRIVIAQNGDRGKALLTDIQTFLGYGKLTEVKVAAGSKPGYQWYVQATPDAEHFLTNIAPHLRLKKDVAEIGLEFLATRGSNGIANRYTEEVAATREALYLKLRQRNRKGIELIEED